MTMVPWEELPAPARLIIQAVAQRHEITPEELRSKSARRHITAARDEAAFLLLTTPTPIAQRQRTMEQVRRLLGFKSYSAVHAAVKRHMARSSSAPPLTFAEALHDTVLKL